MGPSSLPGSLRHSQGNLAGNGGDVGVSLLTFDQSFLEAEDDFCKLEYKNEDLSDLTIRLDRSKILTSGRKGTYSS